ncbi:U2 small nuclear ribonucleoprotein auxiliary factor 35 kDa subunit-related protein 2 isoform X2 [Platichthys flesus]|uniref:U2 small nuclear ribonucleoprotein auxiliary factor 35 kDa subunit-related protein 2 isoform X2 n=1 Tax=Platichthys flesus TaxID=8260 RepID=UPI002DBA68D7|nr:U2 small nuclear ribonucleoprotein auxiliary factor 35 kDa subunit-related protein 2 isoform X2 [Platichthys flesus]
MAASTPPVLSAPVFSQKQRKSAQRKDRRKRKRQALAQAREGLKNGDSCIPEEEEEELHDEDDDDNVVAEEERLRLHEAWLQREKRAQEEFRLRAEKEEAARRRKEEDERMIKEEWDAEQKREQDATEQKRQQKRDKEEAVQKMLDEAENQLENGGPWMNPEAPVTEKSENFGTELDVANCPFFLKTGACRFGTRCSRKHSYPSSSPTLMIRSMFKTFGMEESHRDDYDIDACLEHSEEDLQETFTEFYHDVLPEFKSIGRVVQFKVSCNHEPHLRGNVYIQFDTEEQCTEAFMKFNGRWYAGRQLHCELCPVTRWKNAICGLFDRQRCPKGKHCNFLHVFRNPGNEFWEADRDLHLSPDRSVRGSRRDSWRSERQGDRSWWQRRSSRSPLGSERSHSRREDSRREDSRREDSRREDSRREDSRREDSRRRSRSRERRDSHQDKDDNWSRSRHSERRSDRYLRSRSRDKARSRSRDREQDRLRNRSRDKDLEHKPRNKSEEGDRQDGDEYKREPKERSRSTSTERERIKLSRERSPKKPGKHRKRSNDDTDTHSRHKRSKKSKKKSKKKHKKKNHLPEGTTSSGNSEKESEEEMENNSATAPCERTNETEPILKNCDVDVSIDTEERSPEVKSEESNTDVPVDLLETVT